MASCECVRSVRDWNRECVSAVRRSHLHDRALVFAHGARAKVTHERRPRHITPPAEALHGIFEVLVVSQRGKLAAAAALDLGGVTAGHA